MSGDLVLHLCAPCLGKRSEVTAVMVRQALDAAGLSAQVVAGPCLGPCERPVALSLQGGGSAYVFAGLRLPEDMGDLVATCRTCHDAPGGWIEDARSCGRLRFCLRTRIPGGGHA